MSYRGKIAVRGFQSAPVIPSGSPQPHKITSTIVFDTETDMTPAQKLRVGCSLYRTAKGAARLRLFYDTSNLTPAEVATIRDYCRRHHYGAQTVIGFTRWLARLSREEGLAIVGFNLPFDLSRIASRWEVPQTGTFRGGFTFDLSTSRVRVKVKHLSSRKSLYRWSGMGKFHAVFVDVMTLGAAMLGRSHSLKSLAETLEVTHRKSEALHGLELTEEYLDYLVNDVLTTQDCFDKLRAEYNSYGLATPIQRIYSEASLGKAYLNEFGITPHRESQPDFPEELTGKIISTYYGGRSEVHIRRQSVPIVYTDFLSMYPTVCAKMNLWQFVIAQETRWEDATEKVQAICEEAVSQGPAILRDEILWQFLTTIVRVTPNGDILPVRAKYTNSGRTIGLNYLQSAEPLWYTLADVLGSVFLTGKVPTILEAVHFRPGEPQENLNMLSLLGREDLQINPYRDDFYKRLIELRREAGDGPAKQAIKIIANSTCYGIFVELIADTQVKEEKQFYWTYDGTAHGSKTKHYERPGRFFHPLLATLITGAARLLLASAERLARDRGLDWAFCDTDSVAFVTEDDSQRKEVEEIVSFFEELSPYSFAGSILKVEMEDVNCYAISAKRYALYTPTPTGPEIIKASAHGLGYLKRPYGEGHTSTDAPEWINDIWKACINCEGKDPHEGGSLDIRTAIPAVCKPAVTQVTLNTAHLYRQFTAYNKRQKLAGGDAVRPFGFVAHYQPTLDLRGDISPLSPMQDNDAMLDHIFDRDTGDKVYREQVKTYAEALDGFDLHGEHKFRNGGGRESGTLERRVVIAEDIEVIGKESNRIDPEHWIDREWGPHEFTEKRGRVKIVREE